MCVWVYCASVFLYFYVVCASVECMQVCVCVYVCVIPVFPSVLAGPTLIYTHLHVLCVIVCVYVCALCLFVQMVYERTLSQQ